MTPTVSPAPVIQLPFPLAPGIQAALALLLRVDEDGRAFQRPLWEFAVEITVLDQLGLAREDLRRLLGNGLVEQRLETSRPAAAKRSFRPVANLMFGDRACFVLTDTGRAWSRQSCPGAGGSLVLVPSSGTPAPVAVAAPTPIWNSVRRELILTGLLVKRFTQPAPHQEVVLGALQEEDWPARIDDPIPGRSGPQARKRLQDTLARLNQHQVNRLLRFRGDGTGEGILWEQVLA